MHEYARPWVLWDRCFLLVPEASARFALGLWEHQIANHKTGGFDRHAPYFEHGPMDGKDFARHGAFYIGTWCYAWKHTTNQVFLTAIETILARFERKRVQKDGSFIGTLGPLDLEIAATMVPDPLARRLRDFAAQEDQLTFREIHKQLSLTNAAAAPLWQNGYSAGTLASSAMFYLARHEQTDHQAYRDAVIEIANRYVNSRPPEDVDAWPQSFAHVVSTEVAAYRFTKKSIYLEQAQKIARLAVDIFWGDGNPLPRASKQTGHYEAITGGDSLALALLQVHATTGGLTNHIPSNTIDR